MVADEPTRFEMNDKEIGSVRTEEENKIVAELGQKKDVVAIP